MGLNDNTTKNNLDYMIDPAFRNINRLSFDRYYMSLVEVKDFNAVINNKTFFGKFIKTSI